MNVSASGIVASLGLTLKRDDQTDFLSIANLKLGFNFENAGIVADNLVVDGIPAEWETVNQSIRPIFEKILEAQETYIQLIQADVNKLLEVRID